MRRLARLAKQRRAKKHRGTEGTGTQEGQRRRRDEGQEGQRGRGAAEKVRSSEGDLGHPRSDVLVKEEESEESHVRRRCETLRIRVVEAYAGDLRPAVGRSMSMNMHGTRALAIPKDLGFP